MTIASAPVRVAAVDATVVRNTSLCRDHVAIEAALRSFPPSEPGQFLQLLCTDELETPARSVDWSADTPPALHLTPGTDEIAMLRRPFSIADRWEAADGRSHLVVISRAVGPGTRWLARLRAGDSLNLSGPLGRGFRIPDTARPLVLVGGGVGIPPLLYLARELHTRGILDVTCIFGSMSRDLFPVGLRESPATDGRATPCLALPSDAPFPAIITTDDGSLGLRGYTTTALRTWAEQRAPKSADAPLVLACGPDGMLRAVARETRSLGFACQLCIEKPMGCGLGTCLSCVTQIVDTTKPAGWRWALACTDGPVFDRDALVEYAERQPTA